ncbi:MAG: PaaI family thioesterase [Caulobacteraceae bacterium]|nr:PaaI family thioesterase [Caulobacteraceae bacterium]
MSDEETVPAPPEGFVSMERRGAFSRRNGPFFGRMSEGKVEQAFYALQRHCNGLGIVHGGMLAAFLDGLLANAVGRAAGRPGVTIHLSIDYLAMARAGEWVFGEAQVTRATGEVAFAEARVHNGRHDVVRGSGVFKLMHKRG